jgi:cyclopropane-fatty-acyl-phospholipid synthase
VTTEGGSSGASRSAIEHHYDVGRDFYRLWLDAGMVYSCAYWPTAVDDDIDAAQVAKLDWHATAAGVDVGSRVLDVGCGWGALVAHLVERRGASHVTGLTLSGDQADYAAARVPSAQIRLEDWRDHQPAEPYDAVISIGAFEHFARPDLATSERRDVYGAFFERCASWLRPDGRLSLQTIAYEDAVPTEGPVARFFNEEVFPESSLPSLSDIVVAAEPSFRVLGLRSDGEQYSHTLKLWQRRLEAAQEPAIQLVGRATYRHYLRYLRVSRASFDRHDCTLYRIVLQRRRPSLDRR